MAAFIAATAAPRESEVAPQIPHKVREMKPRMTVGLIISHDVDDRSLFGRTRSRLSTELKHAQLEIRRWRQDGDLYVDYGWIRLLYSGDADMQEIAYHQHQERWYEKDMHAFRSLIAPGQTAIDVGANMGFVTTMLASVVGRHGRVVSFEPSGDVFRKLRKTIIANRLDQVVPINLGCGSSPSSERLNRVGASSGNASIIGQGTHSTKIRVERMDDVPEAWVTPVSLLKIDTEGYEPEVLRGAQRLIEQNRPIIYLEMGGDYVAPTLESIELLEQAGYGVDHVRSIDWSDVGNGSDYFFLPRP